MVKMNKKLSILGCGWLGFPLAISLIQKGYQINGSVTSPHKLKRLKENGINSFIVDIGKTTNNYNEFLDANVLIIAIPPRNIEFFKMLLKNIEKVNLKKVLFISSISVYPLSNEIVTEETSIDQTPLSEIEALFKSSKKSKTTILRFGGLFGYDRKPGNFIRKGQKLKNPEGHVNLIH